MWQVVFHGLSQTVRTLHHNMVVRVTFLWPSQHNCGSLIFSVIRRFCINFFFFQIQGKPIIQQRILPSPAVSIDLPRFDRSTAAPGDENTNIIFSPWKAFGPFVDTVQVRYSLYHIKEFIQATTLVDS